MDTFLIVILWFVLSLVAGIVANSRGRLGIGYFFLSLLASPIVGLLLAGLMPPKLHGQPTEATKRCPQCAEVVLVAARKCKHCGAALAELPRLTDVHSPTSDFSAQEKRLVRLALFVLLAFGALYYMYSGKREGPQSSLNEGSEYTAVVAKRMCGAKIAESYTIGEWVDQDHWRVDGPFTESWIVSARIVGNAPNRPKALMSFSCLLSPSKDKGKLVVTQLVLQ